MKLFKVHLLHCACHRVEFAFLYVVVLVNRVIHLAVVDDVIVVVACFGHGYKCVLCLGVSYIGQIMNIKRKMQCYFSLFQYCY